MEADFTAHLEELRKRVLFCLAVVAVAALVASFFSRNIVDFLTVPLRGQPGTLLVFQKPHEAFVIYIKVALFTGFLISLPVIFMQLWSFLAPGLHEREKKTVLPLVLISAGLFLTGVLFAYYLVIPWGLGFFMSFQTEHLRAMLGISAYFSFLFGMLIAFGILFDFPVVIVGLVELGVVQTAVLRKARKIIIVFIFIAAAILTPSPDPVSQMMLALPLCGLFEISLLVASHKEKKRDSRRNAER